MMIKNFETASIIDKYPQSPSCEIQFKRFGLINKIHGRIRTIKCFQDNGLIKNLFNTTSNGEILVIDGNGSLYSALMGDMIATSGIKNGWAGAIIYGVIRDSQLINNLKIGIKALGTNPKKSTKNCTGEIDIPVSFGNITFNPGDYLYSDEDGIVIARENIL